MRNRAERARAGCSLLVLVLVVLSACTQRVNAPSANGAPAQAPAPSSAAPVSARESPSPHEVGVKTEKLASAPTQLESQELFLSSIGVNAGEAELAVARESFASPKPPPRLSFELLVTLADRASFPYVNARWPNAKVKASRLALPYELPARAPSEHERERWLRPSFVIDFDAPRFQPFATEFDARVAADATPADIEKFVSEYITNKSYSRGFDIASDVASSRTGDCTEHAVLLTAALRRRHIASHVIFGVVLVLAEGPRMRAFGHAWVEAIQGRELVRLDAATLGAEAKLHLLLHYLPISELKDEGIGYSRTLTQENGVESVREVTLRLAAAR